MSGAGGFQALGDALAGGGVDARVRGMMMGQQFADMGAMAQNALSQVPLHGAQTQVALENARAARMKNNAQANLPASLHALGVQNSDAASGAYLASGGNFQQLESGLGDQFTRGLRQDLAKKENLGTPQATADIQALTGKIPTTQPVSKEFTVAPGMPVPVIHETPGGIASNVLAAARTNQANAVASLDQPYSERQGQILAALTADGVSLPSGMRGGRQIRQTLQALDNANPGASPQEIADMVKTGKINFATQTTSSKAFATGKQGQQAQSFGVSLAHLDTLEGIIGTLNNTASPLFNRFANVWKTQTGQAAPLNFDAAKQIVGDEITKAIIAGGGGQGEREKAKETLSNANSPDQLAGVIDTYKNLLTGQLAGLAQTYQHSTGRNDFGSMLMPEARTYYQQHIAAQQQQNAPPQKPPVQPPAPAHISSDAEWNALAPGTLFIGPDGHIRRK